MSETQTFKDIVSSTARKSGHDQALINDFTDNFTEIIQKKLSQNEKVHVAQFGILEVKEIDGAKNVIFRPYKRLRHAVNRSDPNTGPLSSSEGSRRKQPSKHAAKGPSSRHLSQHTDEITRDSLDSSNAKNKNTTQHVTEKWGGLIIAGTCLIGAAALWLFLKKD